MNERKWSGAMNGNDRLGMTNRAFPVNRSVSLIQRIRRQVCKAKVQAENRSNEEGQTQRRNVLNGVKEMLRITKSFGGSCKELFRRRVENQ